jgi:hypothetical protein
VPTSPSAAAGRPSGHRARAARTGIAKRLFVSERTVEAYVRHVLGKLDMPEGEDDHRRVLAVLTHLGDASRVHEFPLQRAR